MSEKTSLEINGVTKTLDVEPDMPLLYALRSELRITDPKFGCGLAQCGACTVQVDGQPVRSCVTPVSAVREKKITTLSGLATPGKPHLLQQAYIEEQVPQCGYCLSGWVMTAAAFLEKNPNPSDREIRQAMTGVKCRCGTHMAILRAIKRAAKAMQA